MPTFDFSGLTPDLILDAIESTGLMVSSGLLPLNSYENRVYQFVTDDGPRFVAKFYRPQRWSQAQLLEEHAFAFELAAQEIPVVAPSRLNGASLHHFQGYDFALFPSVGGRQFEVDNLDQLEWTGRFLGRIHRVGAAKAFDHRPAVTTAAYLSRPYEQLLNSWLVPEHLKAPFFTILEQVVDLAGQGYADVQTLRLHGDCHPGNILWRDGPSFVDLDDCRSGPAVQDLWMMVSGDASQQRLQWETIVEAYEEFNEFNPAELALVEPLRAMRMVHHMAWLDKRWQDPAFPVAFPWFGEDKYWENQILALKEQFSALHEEPIRLTPMY